MEIEITLQNYRCFGNEPVSYRLRPGVTAFLGPNNVGKSWLLKFLFDFRPFFIHYSSPHSVSMLLTEHVDRFNDLSTFNLTSLSQFQEFFCDKTSQNLTIAFHFIIPERFNNSFTLQVEFSRENHSVRTTLFEKNIPERIIPEKDISSFPIVNSPYGNSYTEAICSMFRELSEAFYIGPFRHVLNMSGYDDNK